MESQAGGTPAVTGREIENPDNDRTDNNVLPIQSERPVKKETNLSEDIKTRLKFIPKEMHERVSKLTREELVGVGIPTDREAYGAYLYAEKMMRDERRRVEKQETKGAKQPETYDA
ncbi:MAG: hypothetical protein KKF08_19020 [Gammaproteobacteria bacterium]|nr:hypothetical protein [Gammaproteobacteria bacterium]